MDSTIIAALISAAATLSSVWLSHNLQKSREEKRDKLAQSVSGPQRVHYPNIARPKLSGAPLTSNRLRSTLLADLGKDSLSPVGIAGLFALAYSFFAWLLDRAMTADSLIGFAVLAYFSVSAFLFLVIPVIDEWPSPTPEIPYSNLKGLAVVGFFLALQIVWVFALKFSSLSWGLILIAAIVVVTLILVWFAMKKQNLT